MGGSTGSAMGGMGGGTSSPRQDTGTLQRQRQTDQDMARDQDRDRDRTISKDAVYGAGLMTDRELQRYRERLARMQTAEERNRFLEQHRKRMDARAKQRGVTIDPVENMEQNQLREVQQGRQQEQNRVND